MKRFSVEWSPRWWTLALKIYRAGQREYVALGLGPWTLLLTWRHGRDVGPRAYRSRRLERGRLRFVVGHDPCAYGVGVCAFWLSYAPLDPYNVGVTFDVGPLWASVGWSSQSIDARALRV